MKNRSSVLLLCFCSWPLILLLISLGFAFCLIFCVCLILLVVNHRHNHGNYNQFPGKWGLTKHFMGCMHHSQEKVCPFTLPFKILLLVWNSWDWERNKNRALSMEYNYGLQALIYLSVVRELLLSGILYCLFREAHQLPIFQSLKRRN